MPTFDKREKGYESKFAHDQEMAFKVQARRNKLLGLWAAEKLGLVADAADSYAKQVVISDFEKPGDDDVFDKVYNDLKDKGVSDHQVRREMINLMDVAREQINNET